jgi:hypothetical protein
VRRLCARPRKSVEVTLREPIPLDVPLERDGGRLSRDARLLAEAHPVTLDFDVPDPVDAATAADATRRYVAYHGHPFPNCFVCGPDRREGDGLRMFPGSVGGRVAAPWTPDPSLADGTEVARECVWAALDCPTYFGAIVDSGVRMALLGRLAVEVRGPVHVGQPYVVMGWPLGGDGRKFYGAAAIFDSSGRWVGRSRATWIELRAR